MGLWAQVDSFSFAADNAGSTYTGTGIGTQITAGGTNHTKNASITSLLAGSVITQDCYWLSIGFIAGSSSTASRRFLTDIFFDPAGGTSWEGAPRIPDLLANCPDYVQGGVWYEFPIYIKNGTSIGARCQAETASATVNVIIAVTGRPLRPTMLEAGTRVIAYGVTAASTNGTAVTPGASGSMGSYSASLGTTSRDHWWWQTGVCFTDTSQTAVQYWFDMAIGDANRKYVVQRGILHHNVGTVEQAGRANFSGIYYPAYAQASGANIYVRGVCTGTADSSCSAIVYGVV